jgi:thiamine biosynthesis lipoprotein
VDNSGLTKRRSVTAMAMDFTLDVPASVGDEALDTVMSVVDSDLTWVDSIFSLYRADSEVSRLGRGEISIGDCVPAVAVVLDLCEQYRDETGGAFDARRPDGVIDPTGIVKTWAMERSRWRFQLLGASAWLWGCAGDVTAHGAPVGGSEWRIGVADPRSGAPGDAPLIDAIGLPAGTSVATSGRAHRGEHIWDPRTSAAAQHYAQVSVAGEDLVRCDAWATAIMAGGRKVATAAHQAGLEVLTCAEREGKVFAEATPGWKALRVAAASGTLAQ